MFELLEIAAALNIHHWIVDGVNGSLNDKSVNDDDDDGGDDDVCGDDDNGDGDGIFVYNIAVDRQLFRTFSLQLHITHS